MKRIFISFTSLLPLLATAEESSQKMDSIPALPGEILNVGQYPAGYNAHAGIRLKSDEGKWLPDLFIQGSFLYYHADEDGLDIADSAVLVPNTTGTTFVAIGTANGETLIQDFDYKPGFKIGIGSTLCDWTFLGEYTWIRQTTNSEENAPEPSPSAGPGVWILNNWYLQPSPLGQALTASDIKSRWHLGIDLADLTAGRPFYQGRALTVSPYFGLRAAWIRQNMKIRIHVPEEVIPDPTSNTITSKNSSNSWGLGPRFGMDTFLLLGKGFRLEGDLAASILFTQYTHVRHSENVATDNPFITTIKSSYINYSCLRPMGELGAGFGWGRYLCGEKYHVDLSADYNFIVFWEQNMIRKLVDQGTIGSGASPGDLHLHGLAVTARLDF